MSFALLAVAMLHRTDPDTTFRLPRGSSIEIDSPDRDITVRVGTGDMVVIRGATGDFSGETLEIAPGNRHGNRSRHQEDDTDGGPIDVTVPAWAEVEVNAVSGNVTLQGAAARVRVETIEGEIKSTGGGGKLSLTAVDGTITVTDFHGTDLTLSATSESIRVTNATGTIRADDVSGDVRLYGIRSAAVTANTIDGEVIYEGPLDADGTYSFESHDGNVTLYLPPDVSARMRVTTFDGDFSSEEIVGTTTGGRSPATAAGKKMHMSSGGGESEMTVTYGRGEAHVSAHTFEGSIVVKRAPAPRGRT